MKEEKREYLKKYRKENREKLAEIRHRYYAAHRDAILERQKVYNRAHRAHIKKYQKELREMYLAAGVCPRCGQRDLVPGMRACGACLYKALKDPEQRARSNRRGRERYQRLKAAGMCVDCAKNPAEPGRVRCAGCLGKAKARNRRIYERTHVYKVEVPGVCRMCGEPVMPGRRVCARHYAVLCASLEKARAASDRGGHIWKQYDRATWAARMAKRGPSE